uniref:Protein krueppel n=1 Tax=Stomoxys calcitrans TaxID=35570 RepID=A0A1I8NW37_STOCA
MEINITWNICRVCLIEDSKISSDKNGQLKPLFEEGNKLAANIYQFSGVVMKLNDGLPDKICLKCIKILKYAVYFRTTCRQSDRNLQSIIQRTKAASNMFRQEHRKDILEEELPDDNFYCDDDNEDMDISALNDSDDGVSLDHKTEEEHIEQRSPKQSRNHNMDQKTIKAGEKKLPSESQVATRTTKNVNEAIIEHEEGLVLELVGDNINEDLEHKNSQNYVKTPAEDVANNQEAEGNFKPGHINKSELEMYNDQINLPSSSSTNLVEHMLEETETFSIDDDDTNENFIEHTATESTAGTNIKQQIDENDELYYIINTIKQNRNENEQHTESPKESYNEDDVDYLPMDEEQQDKKHHMDEEEDDYEHNDEEFDDNQSYVTSTVVTKEEIDLEDGNSNISNNRDTEYIIDDFVIDERSTTSQHSNNSPLHNTAMGISMKSSKLQQQMANDIRHEKRLVRKLSNLSSTRKPLPNIISQSVCCELCGNSFSNRHLMNKHMKIHRQEKSHECEICLKRFITACNLQAHMRIHTGEKPFECKFCGRRFTDRSTQIRHERIHTNEKPFTCDNCGKSFGLATSLHAHMRVHTGERPYRCEPCAKSFKLAHQLKAHQNTSLHKTVEQVHHTYIET